MSHSPEGLFGEKVDYSTAHISGKAQNGNVFEWEGETIQHQWNEDRIIKTRRKNDGSIKRTVYIGEFDFDGNTLFTTSQLKYRADFYLTPTSTTYTGGAYLGNGEYEQTPRETVVHQNVESGVLFKYENNIPYPLGSENEHCQIVWKYSEIEDTSDLSMPDSTGKFDLTSLETTTDRKVLLNSPASKYLPEDWWQEPFEVNETISGEAGTDNKDNEDKSIITVPSKFNKKSADKITIFNPSTDALQIDTDSFGIDSSATFATGKNKKAVRKKLSKQDIDFLYDEKKGGLYFNENGADKSFGDGGIIAILKGAPDLTSDNLEFI